MRSRESILYDRDERGEYFQAYTQTFEQRFFFEIVERRLLGLRRRQCPGPARCPGKVDHRELTIFQRNRPCQPV